jgi:tRNA modification GTPase
MSELKTIYALSSGAGRAGVGVVRVSGSESRAVVETLCRLVPEPRRASLRVLRNPADASIIDQGLVLWLPGPHTVTGEDMAEFHVHGSPAVVAELLRCLSVIPGCELAEAGAFTRRGFVNGRIDLVEAEGLADLLAAETDVQRRRAMRQFLGEASSVYEGWRNSVLSALALVEASIDFVEEDGVADAAVLAIGAEIDSLVEQLRLALAAGANAGLVRDGVRVVIAGPPNAGKSSLLNWFSKREAAIVSPIAGTTRDVVETRMVMAGVPVLLSDTAGLREGSGDEIEAMGMARALRAMEGADILIWMVALDRPDSGKPLRDPDIVVLNKCDLASTGMAEYMIRLRNDSAVEVSVKTGAGMDVLAERLSAMVREKLLVSDSAIVVRERHRVAISETIRILNDLRGGGVVALELTAEELRKASRLLGSITGHIDVEDVLGKIFSEFCIGK